MIPGIQQIENRLRPSLTPERGLRWLEGLLVVALAVGLADFTWDLLPAPEANTPIVGPSGLRTADQGQGAEASNGPDRLSPAVKNLFGPPPEEGDSRQDAAEPVRETRLDLTLKGVLAERGSQRRLALIAQGKQEEKVYREGDKVQGAEIVRIENRRVILRRNGMTEALKLEVTELKGEASQLSPGRASSGGGIRREGEHERVVQKDTLQRQLNNLPKLLQQAKAVPHTRNGRKAGFRVVNIQEGSVFNDLGIREGDVIRSVNDTAIRTPKQALTAYQKLKSSTSFRVDVLREGQPVTLRYSVQ